MAISSCPRCTQQVTLPVGVSNDAQVRCPLCRAQYTLADALVNMPPLLEVVTDSPESVEKWFDAPSRLSDEERAPAAPASAQHTLDELGLASEIVAPAETIDEIEPAGDLKFEAREIEHDDIIMQQQDTEIEELALGPPELMSEDSQQEVEPFNVAATPEENVLDFGEPIKASDEGDLGLAEEPADGGEPEIDFGDALSVSEPTAEQDAELDFALSPEPAAASDEPEIDFGELEPAGAASEDGAPSKLGGLGDDVLDFGQPDNEPAADGGLGLDFGDPVATDEPAAEAADENKSADEPATDKKSKKAKKEKKKKLIKPPADSPRKRSLVGTLTNIVLPGIVAVPLALIGALWISPDYDFLGMGPKLAGYGLAPSSFNKKRPVLAQAQAPATPPLQISPQQSPAAKSPAAEPANEAPPGSEPPALTKPEPAEPSLQPTTPATPAEDATVTDDAPPAPVEDVPETTVPTTPAAEAAAPAKPAVDMPEASAADSTANAAPDESKDDSLDSLLKDDSPDEAAQPEKMAPEKARVPAELPEPAAAVATDSTEKTVQPPALPSAPEAKASETAPVEDVRPRDAREATPAELAKALQSFSQAREKMTAAQAADDKSDLKKVRAVYYLSLYGLADALAFAKSDPTDERLDAERQSVQRLALELAGDATRRNELKSYGAKWLAFPKRTTPGIVLSGTVQSTEQIGKLYHLKIAMAADAPAVTVVSNFDPRLDQGDEVLALGSIVERPQEQLSDYAGTDAALVWSGMTLKVPQ